MSRQFKVTIVRTITSEIFVGGDNAESVRKFVEEYGVDCAAADMATQDVSVVSRIRSIKRNK